MENRKLLAFISILLLLIISIPPPLYSQGRVAGEIIMERGIDLSSGPIFFVDDSGSDEGASNGSIASPFATIDYAVGRCTASVGCYIYGMPGHAETLSVADGIDVDVANVHILGMGVGTDRPVLTFATSTAAEINIDAANVEFANFYLVNAIANQVALIELTANADGAHIHDNVFQGVATSGLVFITVGDADDVWIDNNYFYGDDSSSNQDTAISLTGTGSGTDRIRITNNYMYAEFDLAGIYNVNGVTPTQGLIKGNEIVNTLTGAHAIELLGANTGLILDNRLYTDTLATSLDPGSMYSAGNLWVGAIDEDAQPVPTSQQWFPGLGYRVIKSDNTMATDEDALFTVTGTVAITLLIGEVTTTLSGGNNSTFTLETGNDVAISAATTITADADGTMYVLAGDFGSVLNGLDIPTLEVTSVSAVGTQAIGRQWVFVGNHGISVTIQNDLDATGVGIVRWTLFYIPLSPGATVVAAA